MTDVVMSYSHYSNLYCMLLCRYKVRSTKYSQLCFECALFGTVLCKRVTMAFPLYLSLGSRHQQERGAHNWNCCRCSAQEQVCGVSPVECPASEGISQQVDPLPQEAEQA